MALEIITCKILIVHIIFDVDLVVENEHNYWTPINILTLLLFHGEIICTYSDTEDDMVD